MAISQVSVCKFCPWIRDGRKMFSIYWLESCILTEAKVGKIRSEFSEFETRENKLCIAQCCLSLQEYSGFCTLSFKLH